MTLLIVGNRGGASVGEALLRGAVEQNLRASMLDMKAAAHPSRWVNAAYWHGLGHLPARLAAFSRHVLAEAVEQGACILVTTGQAPVRASELDALGKQGVYRVNYSTDDPWNPAHHAQWFMRTLPHYDVVFTPRTANLNDFRSIGVQDIRHLPFGYDPMHCVGVELEAKEESHLACDVLFVGGADRDRVPFAEALVRAGIDVALYGGYWERYPALRSSHRGLADPETIRQATLAARVVLILVRRANRDGHTMRSVEAGAIGACVLAEDTPDHRALYGDGAAFFSTPGEMVAAARLLLEDPTRRQNLADLVRARIRTGHHTYRDRLHTLLAP